MFGAREPMARPPVDEATKPEFQHQERPQNVTVISLMDVFILRPQPLDNTFAEVASLLESRAAKANAASGVRNLYVAAMDSRTPSEEERAR